MEQDIFVGIVAIATGLFVIVSAFSQSPWVNRFWIARRVEKASNESWSRMVVIALGALCTVLGAMLLLGFFPGEQSRNHPRQKQPTHDRGTQPSASLNSGVLGNG